MAAISIVIPTLDRASQLERALGGIAASARGHDAELIVAGDAAESDPGATAALTATVEGIPARHLTAPRPGAAAARNAGWRAAESELILFLDDDVVAGRDLVGAHLEAHRRRPEAAIGILGHVRWARELRVTPLMRWVEHGIQFDYPRIEGNLAGWGRFYTANVSVKRSVLERVGGFDEVRFPFGLEDLDLAYRLHHELGFELLYEPAAVAEHLHEMDLGFWRRRVRRIAVAERTFREVHPDVEPYFHRLFSHAASKPPASGRGRALIRLLPRDFPVLGPLAWNSADLYFAQALAPEFLDAWEHDRAGGGPDLGERGSAGLEQSPA